MLIALGAGQTPAVADVYKCLSASGKVEFSDRPCQSGKIEKLAAYSTRIEPRVSGSVQRNGAIRSYVDGLAYWDLAGKELIAWLFQRPVSSQERELVASGNLSAMDGWYTEGIAKITFVFEQEPASRETLRHMRSVFSGFEKGGPRVPWTSNHASRYLDDRVQQFSLQRDDDGDQWLVAKTRESSQYINWQLTFTVEVLR
jgi:hypothetical protein